MAHLALYGTLGIVRTYCQECQRTCLVIDNVKQCCDQPMEGYAKGVRRIVGTEPKRKQPNKWQKEAILEEQDYRCLYCGRRFGAVITLRGKTFQLRLQWDHVLPFIQTHNNDVDNFAASCHVCNYYKRDRIFTDLEEARIYVAERWERANSYVHKNLPSVRNILSDEETEKDILH